ncbi:hypothetical protein [Microcoleus sp. BR0-C5]|uniref:hypothetical protein n=1 Tax=Microcoleus sp. BR0-C5 TaxID=2818713 RepID=UPI002FD03727
MLNYLSEIEPANLLNQLKGRIKKSKADLRDVTVILEILEEVDCSPTGTDETKLESSHVHPSIDGELSGDRSDRSLIKGDRLLDISH